MARRLHDQVIVVDVESTCWEGLPPEGEESEIIEVGIATLDLASGERRRGEALIVRPERSTASSFCTELTTITQEMVEAGVAFAEACAVLRRRYRSKERVWASYGNYDRKQFEKECAAKGVPYPFGPSHINVKTLFALACGLHREPGMAEALDRLGLPLEGTHHRGGDDAWNIAGILSRLILAARSGCAGGGER